MKKKLLSILCIALVVLLLASCGSAKYADSTNYNNSGGTAPSALKATYDDSYLEKELYDYAAAPEADYGGEYAYDTISSNSIAGTGVSVGVQTNVSLTEKIIYSANANLETIHFEETLESLKSIITQFNAFVESSYESGTDYATKYYGYNSYRNASYVIRVPRENFSAMTNLLSTLGHVTSLYTDAVNVSEQYTDVESRLTVYRTEESRLLSMLEKCENVADMITIESTLSNVRYEIESLTSQLKNLDNRVNYSSVSLYIYEVEELTPVVQTHRTYWQQMTDGLKDTLAGVGNFFKNLLKFLVVASPVIVIIAVIAIVIIVIYKRYMKRVNKKREIKKAAEAASAAAAIEAAASEPAAEYGDE